MKCIVVGGGASSPPIRVKITAVSVSVCLCVYLREHISKTDV